MFQIKSSKSKRIFWERIRLYVYPSRSSDADFLLYGAFRLCYLRVLSRSNPMFLSWKVLSKVIFKSSKRLPIQSTGVKLRFGDPPSQNSPWNPFDTSSTEVNSTSFPTSISPIVPLEFDRQRTAATTRILLLNSSSSTVRLPVCITSFWEDEEVVGKTPWQTGTTHSPQDSVLFGGAEILKYKKQ